MIGSQNKKFISQTWF